MPHLQVCPLSTVATSHAGADIHPTAFRIRRVKCDETKPFCHRCTDSGRRCEGPATYRFRFVDDEAIIWPRKPLLESGISLFAPQHTHDERRAVDLFVRNLSPLFAGAMDAAFWSKLVPSLAQSSPFVWDTLVSISIIFEHVPYESLIPTFASNQNRPPRIINAYHAQALRVYNRGILNLRQQTKTNGLDISIALLSCVLFASLEFQQRNAANALNLMERGWILLDQSLSTTPSSPVSSTNIAIREVVTPFFSRHAILMATLGSHFPPERRIYAEKDALAASGLSALSQLIEVRTELCHLLWGSYEIIRVGVLLCHDDYEMEKLLPRQQELLQQLREWKISFVDAWSHRSDPGLAQVSSYLLMYWAVCYTWLATCTSPLQMVFDEHRDHFVGIVDHAESYLNCSAEQRAGRPALQFEPGVIPPLYFCAMKCRDPTLRRKAVQLMQRDPRRECIWACLAMDRVMEKVISLEEGDDHIDLTTCSPTPEPTKWPPEERRLHYVAVISNESSHDSQRLTLQLTKFVLGADGSRRINHENIWMDDYKKAPAMQRVPEE